MKKLFILFLVAFTLNINLFAKKVEFRPLSVYVYDAETKKPLRDVIVTNMLIFEKTTNFLVDSQTKRKIYIEQYKTDVNGLVEIPRQKYDLGWRYKFYRQNVYINILYTNIITSSANQYTSPDFLDMSYYNAQLYKCTTPNLIRPMAQYEGVSQMYSQGRKAEETSEDGWLGKIQTKEYGSPFQDKPDTLIVYLRKYDSIDRYISDYYNDMHSKKELLDYKNILANLEEEKKYLLENIHFDNFETSYFKLNSKLEYKGNEVIIASIVFEKNDPESKYNTLDTRYFYVFFLNDKKEILKQIYVNKSYEKISYITPYIYTYTNSLTLSISYHYETINEEIIDLNEIF